MHGFHPHRGSLWASRGRAGGRRTHRRPAGAPADVHGRHPGTTCRQLAGWRDCPLAVRARGIRSLREATRQGGPARTCASELFPRAAANTAIAKMAAPARQRRRAGDVDDGCLGARGRAFASGKVQAVVARAVQGEPVQRVPLWVVFGGIEVTAVQQLALPRPASGFAPALTERGVDMRFSVVALCVSHADYRGGVIR